METLRSGLAIARHGRDPGACWATGRWPIKRAVRPRAPPAGRIKTLSEGQLEPTSSQMSQPGARAGRAAQPADRRAAPSDSPRSRKACARRLGDARPGKPEQVSPTSGEAPESLLSPSASRNCQRYRSDFFGRLREILGQPVRHPRRGRPLRVPAPRCCSRFRPGSHRTTPAAPTSTSSHQRDPGARPPDPAMTFNWTLRVDGHTDMRARLSGGQPLPAPTGNSPPPARSRWCAT